MTEPQISPLARRLAEENSIDWRVIPGTGPENRVIERDILTYLARIMSGEIDPPALADASEPPAPGGAVPDLSEVSNLAAASAGMAKEGIDLSSLLGSAAPIATSTVSSLAAPEIVASTFTPSQPVNLAPIQAEPLPSSPLDFTFSDAPHTVVDAPSSVSLDQISFGEPASFDELTFNDPAPFVQPMIQAPFVQPTIEPSKGSPADSLDAEFEIDLDDFDDPPATLDSSAVAPATELTSAEPQASTQFMAHQEDLVLDVESTSEAALTVAAMDATSEIDDDLVMADVAQDFIAPTMTPALNLEPSASESAELELENLQLEAVELEPMVFEPTAPATTLADSHDDDFEFDLVDAEVVSAQPTALSTPEVIAPSIEEVALSTPAEIAPEPIAAPQLTALTPEPTVTADAPEAHAGAIFADVSPEPEETVAEPAFTASVPVMPEALPHPMANVVQPAETATPEPQAMVTPSSPTASSPIATGFFQGFAIRRHFDANALTKMQHELTQALNGREVPLTVFLARAAQRNLHTLGINDGVTLARVGDILEPLSASGLHHSFIEAVQSVARATPGAAQGLLVLDISHLGADDLVLPGVQPILTLHVKGEYGHLALAGDVSAAKAADFLGKVAEALEIPVSLVI